MKDSTQRSSIEKHTHVVTLFMKQFQTDSTSLDKA